MADRKLIWFPRRRLARFLSPTTISTMSLLIHRTWFRHAPIGRKKKNNVSIFSFFWAAFHISRRAEKNKGKLSELQAEGAIHQFGRDDSFIAKDQRYMKSEG